MRWKVRIAVAWAGVVLCAGAAFGASPYTITLYEHKNFEGRALTYSEAVWNLSGTGLNDKVSSVKVVLGQRWLLCKDKKYRGGCIIVDRDVTDLAPYGFNDRISSLKPID